MTLNPFQQISEENYRRLAEYIQRVRDAGLKLPSRGGKVNKTAVATACGFNRETFAQNKRFDQLLSTAVNEIGLDLREITEPTARSAADKSRITMLEQQVASLRSENYELRRKLARYEHATVTGRRVLA
jgi:uncharacterized protein YceH (UPF0502 family)